MLNSYFHFFRHPSGHAYFDPSDFLEGMQQDMEREELEYEVNIMSANEDLPVDIRCIITP